MITKHRYAIAVISLLDNENKVFIEQAEDELMAMCHAVISFSKPDVQLDMLEVCKACKTVDELKRALFSCEIGISDALLIS